MGLVVGVARGSNIRESMESWEIVVQHISIVSAQGEAWSSTGGKDALPDLCKVALMLRSSTFAYVFLIEKTYVSPTRNGSSDPKTKSRHCKSKPKHIKSPETQLTFY